MAMKTKKGSTKATKIQKKEPDTSSSDEDISDNESFEEEMDEHLSESDYESSIDDEDEDNLDGKVGFTDENSSWLKPKVKGKVGLLDSSEDDDSNVSSDDDEELLEVERESRLLDKQIEQEKEEAEQELHRTIADSTAVFHLPTEVEVQSERDGTRVVSPSELKERINDILTVLGDFKNRRELGRSRTEYIAQLSSDMAEVFGYLPELVDYFLTMFNPSETLEFLEASDSPRPLVIRTNTLKCRRKDLAASLLKRGVTLDPLANWSKVGLKITASPIPIGATPEYLSGQYMLQSAASFCPVLALSPSPGNEKVLDMSAAPGGKTSYLAQLMRNTGLLVANDLKPERQKATVANLHRLGVRNTITCCYDGRKLGKLWKNRFNKILLDAPCSGLGVISRDPSVKVQRTIKEVERCGVLQKELLLSAIDALSCKGKNGGIMVYSTCSVSVTENEDVVNYVLKKRDVRLLDTGLDFGKPGFTRYQQKRYHPSLALTRRFYPHVHNMDGFYVAKIQKLSDKHPCDDDEENWVDDEVTEENEDKVEEGDVDNDEIDWANEVRKATMKSSSKGEQEKANKMNKTNKRQGSTEDNKNDNKRQKVKSNKISIPPKRGNKKSTKNSTNANVTKPRRRKVESDI